jgi:hypothetical protein
MLGLTTGGAASLKSCTKGGQTMKSYTVHRSPDFRVTRDGELLIIRQLSLRGSQASVEVTMQGDEGYELEADIERMQDAEYEPTVIDDMLMRYF